MGSRKFLPFLSTHATLQDIGSPSGISPLRFLCIGFRYVNNVADCIYAITILAWLQGYAYPLWPMGFSVYASSPLFAFAAVITACNAPPDTQHSIRVVG